MEELMPDRNKTKTHYDRKLLTIEVDDGMGWYQVDLERCDGSAEVLDFIAQIAEKGWCRPETLADFIVCLDEACHDRFRNTIQGVFCSCGIDHKVDWKKRTSKPRQ